MKRPIFKDYKPEKINCAEDMSNWYEAYSKAMERYADHLEADKLVKKSDTLLCISDIPNWLRIEEVETAMNLFDTHGKLAAVKHIYSFAQGKCPKPLEWSKKFIENCR